MVLGNENVDHAKIHDIAKDQTLQQDVAYKMLNIDDDMSASDIERVDVCKKWITQDMFTGRSIYAHKVTFRPTTRLMFMANGLYEIPNSDDAEAIYERTHLIKLHNKFRNTEKEEKNIFENIENLDDELDGFVTYLLQNITWIVQNNTIHHRQSTSETREMWNEFGNQIKNFIETWIEKDSMFKQEKTGVLKQWLDYSIEHNIAPKGKIKFYSKFEEIIGNVSTKVRVSADVEYWGYHGFRLRTSEDVLRRSKHVDTVKERVLKRISRINDEDFRLFAIEDMIS